MRIAFAVFFAAAPAFASDASLVSQLTGASGKGSWVSEGGTCRRPDLIFARGAMGLTVRFASSSEEGSQSGFSTAKADGAAEKFTLRFDQIDPETLQMSRHSFGGVLDGARLTLTDQDGTRRVYTHCDGDAPARKWELE